MINKIKKKQIHPNKYKKSVQKLKEQRNKADQEGIRKKKKNIYVTMKGIEVWMKNIKLLKMKWLLFDLIWKYVFFAQLFKYQNGFNDEMEIIWK